MALHFSYHLPTGSSGDMHASPNTSTEGTAMDCPPKEPTIMRGIFLAATASCLSSITMVTEPSRFSVVTPPLLR